MVPTAHIKLKDIRPEPTDCSTKSLKDRHTHTGVFLGKDPGVFPPIKCNPTDDRYIGKNAASPKKFVLREELISKVVHP